MSQCYLGSESKNSMTKFYFEVFIANYFYTFNKKDPVVTYLYIILYFIILGQGYFLIISPLTIHSSILVYSRMKDCERIL